MFGWTMPAVHTIPTNTSHSVHRVIRKKNFGHFRGTKSVFTICQPSSITFSRRRNIRNCITSDIHKERPHSLWWPPNCPSTTIKSFWIRHWHRSHTCKTSRAHCIGRSISFTGRSKWPWIGLAFTILTSTIGCWWIWVKWPAEKPCNRQRQEFAGESSIWWHRINWIVWVRNDGVDAIDWSWFLINVNISVGHPVDTWACTELRFGAATFPLHSIDAIEWVPEIRLRRRQDEYGSVRPRGTASV